MSRFCAYCNLCILSLALLLAGLCRPARAGDDLEIAEFKAHAGNFSAAAISNDGKQAFMGEDDGLVTLWSVGGSGTEALRNYTGHTREVFATALLPDGKRGLSCGDDNLVIVWDLPTSKRACRYVHRRFHPMGDVLHGGWQPRRYGLQ